MAAIMAAMQSSRYAIETIEGMAKREAAKDSRMQERTEAMKAEYELIQKKQSKLSANKRAYIVHWYERHYGKNETPESK